MPLTPRGTTRAGLGLWNSVPGTVALEGAIFFTGAFAYLQATRPRDRIGSIGCWVLLAFLIAVYIANLIGPPPPSASVVAWSTVAMWVIPDALCC